MINFMILQKFRLTLNFQQRSWFTMFGDIIEFIVAVKAEARMPNWEL